MQLYLRYHKRSIDYHLSEQSSAQYRSSKSIVPLFLPPIHPRIPIQKNNYVLIVKKQGCNKQVKNNSLNKREMLANECMNQICNKKHIKNKACRTYDEIEKINIYSNLASIARQELLKAKNMLYKFKDEDPMLLQSNINNYPEENTIEQIKK